MVLLAVRVIRPVRLRLVRRWLVSRLHPALAGTDTVPPRRPAPTQWGRVVVVHPHGLRLGESVVGQRYWVLRLASSRTHVPRTVIALSGWGIDRALAAWAGADARAKRQATSDNVAEKYGAHSMER